MLTHLLYYVIFECLHRLSAVITILLTSNTTSGGRNDACFHRVSLLNPYQPHLPMASVINGNSLYRTPPLEATTWGTFRQCATLLSFGWPHHVTTKIQGGSIDQSTDSEDKDIWRLELWGKLYSTDLCNWSWCGPWLMNDSLITFLPYPSRIRTTLDAYGFLYSCRHLVLFRSTSSRFMCSHFSSDELHRYSQLEGS